MITADSPFLDVCRISAGGFVAALEAYPANRQLLDERDPTEYWTECRAWGVDPCFILSMAVHESSLGNAGTAVRTRSWGNTRSPSFGACPADVVPGRSGEFPAFPSWLDGCASTAGRLSSPVWPAVAPYGLRSSIGEVFDHPTNAVWAPGGDLNDPSGYLNAMLAAMNEYADQDDEAIVASRPPAPAIYADYLALNHSPGRAGHRPRAILLHITQSGSAAGTINWFKNPAAKVSCHYIIERNGVITALVREADTAWINGALIAPNTSIAVVDRWMTEGINPNTESIGIECVGYSPAQPHPDRPDLSGYTDAQMDALAFLLPAIGRRWGIDLEPGSCFGHAEVDSVNRADCPGLSEGEWADIWAMDAVAIETADDAFDDWLKRHGDSALWAGQITGKAHWYGLDPLSVCRTVGGRLLAYDGIKATDATGWPMDEWQEASLASGQLTIF